MQYIIKRLKEPSTYAGFSGTMLALGLAVPGWYGAASQALAGLFGVVAFLMAENKDG
jgi:hypothetical protein